MNQLSSLKYDYFSYLFRSILFEQSISKNFIVLVVFVPCSSDLNLLTTLSLKSKGKLYPFKKSSLIDLTKRVTPLVSSGAHFYLRGIATHKCALLRLPLTPLNLKLLTEFRSKNLPLLFTLYSGLYLSSFVYKLISLKVPYISNIIMIIFFCLHIILRKLLSRFILLNLLRKLA